MPENIKNIGKKEILFNSKLTKTDFKTDLNIVLEKEQIEILLLDLIKVATTTGNVGPVALISDYCCVDASVGSSVAGPFSSVASSVSVDPNMRLSGLRQRATQESVKVNVMLPEIKGIR